MPARRPRRPAPSPSDPEAVLSHRTGTDGLELWVHVRPGARSDAVGGVHGGALAVRVRAAARDGAANAAVSRALARAFGVAASDVELAAGPRSRRKRVRVRGPWPALRRRLEQLAEAEDRV